MNSNITPEYQEQLRKEHAGSKWGSTAWRYGGADVITLLNERPYIRSVLDFGAGKGTMREHVLPHLDRNIEWTDYDPGVPGIDKPPRGQFDLVLTCDVLEHIEPGHIRNAIWTLANLTGKVMYNNIACYPTGKLFGEGPYKGEDLHLIIEDPHWWQRFFDSALPIEFAQFEYRHIERQRQGRTIQRAVLVHERVK